MSDFTVARAAEAIGLPESHIRGWVQRAALDGIRAGGPRRVRFDKRGLRVLRLMRALTEAGVSPNSAAPQAATIVDRARGLPLLAVFSPLPNISPILLPMDEIPKLGGMQLILINLGELFADLP